MSAFAYLLKKKICKKRHLYLLITHVNAVDVIIRFRLFFDFRLDIFCVTRIITFHRRRPINISWFSFNVAVRGYHAKSD